MAGRDQYSPELRYGLYKALPVFQTYGLWLQGRTSCGSSYLCQYVSIPELEIQSFEAKPCPRNKDRHLALIGSLLCSETLPNRLCANALWLTASSRKPGVERAVTLYFRHLFIRLLVRVRYVC